MRKFKIPKPKKPKMPKAFKAEKTRETTRVGVFGGGRQPKPRGDMVM